MKKSEIRVGGFYKAKVSDKVVTVRVDAIRSTTGYASYGSPPRDGTAYDVTNLSTGRKTTFRSAAKFREETTDPNQSLKQIVNNKTITVPETDPIQSKNVGGQHGGPVASAKEEAESAAILNEMELKCVETFRSQSTQPNIVDNVPNPKKTLADSLRKTPAVADDSPHLIVEARAGTGKTTTLVEGLKRVVGIESALTPSPQQKAVWDAMAMSKGKVKTICFVAFNKSIAEELKSRVPAGCQASTMHGMGFKAVRNAFGNVQVNEYRVSDIIAELLGRDIRELRRDPRKCDIIQATTQLVGLCKMNLVHDDSPTTSEKLDGLWWSEQLDQLAGHYEVELNGNREEVFGLVPRVLERCQNVAADNCIDYNDMIWLPVALNLPVFKFDMLLVDEAQDLNRCQQALAKMAGRRLILCGDPKQAIYGFAGADAESMKRMGRELEATDRGVTLLPLTVTRRCGKGIVEEARKIVPDFEAFETNPEGIVRRGNMTQQTSLGISLPGCYQNEAQDGDMVLCRVNAPLVSECFRFIKAGRKANIQGRDVGKGLISTVTKTKAENVVDLSSRLSDWLHDETKKETAKRNPSENRLIALQDRYDCLMCFLEGAKTVQEVIQKIEAIFTDDKKSPGIRLSSVHKAKGLEAHRVFILQPEGASMPHPMAKSPWQKEQEFNLLYVAITRAISELVYVS